MKMLVRFSKAGVESQEGLKLYAMCHRGRAAYA